MVKLALAFAAAVPAVADHWAVLVAGSNGFGNYRHQADACHAYQVMKSKGISEDKIIMMAYDDVANNNENPFPGKLFNKPTAAGTPGTDVYAGCNIDYKGTDVTPENFLAVLTGTAKGKKLQSTEDDNVFVSFFDHGAPGLIAFPTGAGELHKADLQGAFATMHSNKMYKKLTFYLESCESGSMFQGLSVPGVYGVSAANPTESSWGTYCGSDAMVDGKNVGSCLGDLFSVNWLEDSDANDLTKETLDSQFQAVKTLTAKSHVMQWGDVTYTSDEAGDFIGVNDESAINGGRPQVTLPVNSVSARQVDLKRLYEKYVNAKDSSARLAAGKELQDLLSEQLETESVYTKFLDIVYSGDDAKIAAATTNNAPADNRDCELAVRKEIVQNGKFDASTGFALQFHKYVVNVCADSSIDAASAVQAAKQACVGTTVV